MINKLRNGRQQIVDMWTNHKEALPLYIYFFEFRPSANIFLPQTLSDVVINQLTYRDYGVAHLARTYHEISIVDPLQSFAFTNLEMKLKSVCFVFFFSQP